MKSVSLKKFISGVDHIALSVPDLEEGLSFFRDLLGFQKKFDVEFEGHRIVILNAGKITIELWADPDGITKPSDSKEYGVHHFGIKIRDIEAVMPLLEEIGVESITGIYEPTDGLKEAIVRGPGGVRVQLVEQNIPRLLLGMISGKSK